MTPQELQQHLSEHLSTFESAPFLFVGSGLSRRYINLETWEALLNRFSQDLTHKFPYYKSKSNGNLPLAATLIADDFHEAWWNTPTYADSRKTHGDKIKTKDACLKVEISKYILSQKYQPEKSQANDAEISKLKNATISGIITTNWDTLLEETFPDFKKYTGQEQVIFSHPQGIGEIYKIHGCATQPDSLILTEADYNDFDMKNPYLTAKLSTIFIEHPVIFLGYSLSDSNILKILTALAKCLSSSNIEKLKDRLIFVNWEQDPLKTSMDSSLHQIDGKSVPITIIKTDSFLPIYEVLKSIKRKFPAKLLRALKEHIYELVHTNDPTNKMYVLDMESTTPTSEFEVVYGVGLSEKIGSLGYTSIGLDDLLEDVVFDSGDYNSEKILEHTIPQLLKSSRKYVPIYKYLKEAGRLKTPGNPDLTSLAPKIAQMYAKGHDLFMPPQMYAKKKSEIQAKFKSIDEICAQYEPRLAVYFIPLLPIQLLDKHQLHSFILENIELLKSDEPNSVTYMKSTICLYDWIKHGKP